jgi:hypothetical protein
MECDLLEVSGQMALPLPTHTIACLLPPDVSSLAVPRLLILIPEPFSQGLLWISNVARLWSATGPGWLYCAASAKMRGAARQLELKE